MQYIPAKTMIAHAPREAWFGMDYNMNIYRGCCHGCIYCDSRSACYQNPEFDTVKAKQDALVFLQNELKRKTKTGVIATGSMSDPYNPFEQRLELTRGALKLIDRYGFGVAIATKSPLIARDIDVLASIRSHSPVLAKITVTTMDDTLCKRIEQGVEPSSQRVKAINALSEAGIYTGVLLMPVLPFINDTIENVLDIVRAAKQAGARFVYAGMGVTLRAGQREYFYKKLDEEFPAVRRQYEQLYGDRYSCSSPKAKELYAALAQECEKSNILYKMKDITRDYKSRYGQMSFF